jgi:HPt (histidine-containing phosphotransfer) domain-containing protein
VTVAESQQQKALMLYRRMCVPLQDLIRVMGLLAETELDTEQRGYLDALRAQVQSLREIIDRDADPVQAGIDTRILQRLLDFNVKDRVGLFEELIFGFLEQAGCKIGELEQQMRERDIPRMVQTAHTLKGMSLNFGALALAKECESFQRLAESAENPDLTFSLDRIRDVFSLARETLSKFADKSAPRLPNVPPEPHTDGPPGAG